MSVNLSDVCGPVTINPNKFRGNINEARSCVRLIESVLKTNGTLPLTEQEQLNKDLDAKFPNARSKENAKMANDAVDWLLHKNQDPRTTLRLKI